MSKKPKEIDFRREAKINSTLLGLELDRKFHSATATCEGSERFLLLLTVKSQRFNFPTARRLQCSAPGFSG